MPSQKNVDQLKQIKDKLDTASCMILVNYSGISVADQQTLRNNLSENDGSFNVQKHSNYPGSVQTITRSSRRA